MTPVYLDTNVFAYALGAAHPYREPCRAIVARVVARRLDGHLGAEVIQELVHVRRRRGYADATQRGRDLLAIARVHDLERRDVVRALDLMDAYPTLPPRDALHAATALNRGIGVVLSADRHFDVVDGLERVDPLDRAAVAAVTRGGAG